MTVQLAQFTPFYERMVAEQLPEIFIHNFAHYYERLVAGDDGMIPEHSIVPVDTLTDVDVLPAHLETLGRETVSRTVIIKLNGGLGTGMGLTLSLIHI